MPTWIFLNSLQLVTHLVLFYSQLPPVTALFLGQLLYITRFNPVPSWIFMERSYGHLLEGAHNVQFQTFGYRSLYLPANLNWILIAGSVFMAIWLLIWIKEICKVRFGRNASKERVYVEN